MKVNLKNNFVPRIVTCFLGLVILLLSVYIIACFGKCSPKVSIVIPVYNTEKYLDECLNSIEDQTLKEIEIICVNDGSKDNSLAILEKHSKKDKRIRILNQKNSGVSVARNNGIKISRGKYIMFVDSDDIVPRHACQKAYNCAEDHDVQVVCLGNICYIDGDKVDLNSFKYDESKVKEISCENYQNPYYSLKIEMSSVWNKIWRKSFLVDNNIYFKEGISRGEDGLFNCIAFSGLRKTVHDDNVFYCYRQNRPESALTTSNAKKILESVIPASQELVENRWRFEFQDSDEWLLGNILGNTFVRITEDLSDKQDRVYFSKKVLTVIDDYLKRYNVTPSKENQKKINSLRKIAEHA